MTETSLVPPVEHRLLGRILLVAVLLSVLPMALHLAGVKFGFHGSLHPVEGAVVGPGGDLIQAVQGAVARRMTHSLLEWVAATLAITTFLLAVVNFGVRQELTTALLGLALLTCGVMDGLHALAADQLFPGVLEGPGIGPVTWAISRAYKALVLTGCMACFLWDRPRGRRFATGVAAAILAALALGALAMFYTAYSGRPLPAMLFPLAAVPRPYDLGVLLLFLVAGLTIYPRFYARHPGIFSALLVASVIPEVAAQAHAAFGAREAFGNHFTMAHLAKVAAYLLPFAGLCLEYVKPNRELKRAVANYREAERALQESQAQFHAIHDNVLEGIITIDETGTMVSANPFAERIFGYSAAELEGRNVRMLMPEPFRSEHDQYLRRYLTTGKARVIGIGREVTGQRKDGSQFPMELSVNEMVLGGRRLFTGTMRDITERKEVDRLKAEFISTVSHELRTPLASIVGYADVLLDGEAGAVSEKQAEFLQVIARNGTRLNGLIGELLDIEKLEQGQATMETRVLNLSDILSMVGLTFNVTAERKGLEVLTAFPPGLQVSGDADRLTQVFSNLISNAIKYTPKGWVRVEATERKGKVVVTISDSGIGMTGKTLEHLFTKFFRADDPYARSAGGTGLGLAIARAIVQQHRGSIEAGSSPGKGSWFRVELPGPAAARPVPESGDEAQPEAIRDPSATAPQQGMETP